MWPIRSTTRKEGFEKSHVQSTWSKNVILRMTPALRMSYGSARRLVPTQHMVSN